MSRNIFAATETIEDDKIAFIRPPVVDGVVMEKASQDGAWSDGDLAVPSIESSEMANRATDEANALAETIKQEAEEYKANAKTEADAILEQAREEAARLLEDAQSHYSETVEKGRQEGIEIGRGEGFKEGYAEAGRLIERMHLVINKIIDKRKAIFEQVEGQVIELAILMVKKVVKVLASNEKTVITNNIMQAIKRLKDQGDIVIKLNMEDLKMASSQKDDFTKAMESGGQITFVEDNSIEMGGCVVESDFGGVDARISTQLMEVEDKIRELLPK